MADWRASPARTHVASSVDSSTGSRWTAITGTGWEDMIASLPCDIDFIKVTLWTSTTSYSSTRAIDIGYGPAASEVMLIENIVFKGKSMESEAPVVLQIPVSLAAGTRIAVRANSSASCFFRIDAYSGGAAENSPIGTFDILNSEVVCDPGGTINTKGSWHEIVASTARDYRGILTQTGFANGMDNALNFYDIAVGAAASEVIIVRDGQTRGNTSENVGLARQDEVNIPAGSRLSVRSTSNLTDVTDRVTTFSFHGWT